MNETVKAEYLPWDAEASAIRAASPREPAWESGPHLQEPGTRAEKRAQMEAAGITPDDPRLTKDMRAILVEWRKKPKTFARSKRRRHD